MKKIIIPKSVRYFTDEDKREVIKDYLSSGSSKGHIWRKYTGKSDHGRLLRWMRDLAYMSKQSQLNRRFASQTNKMPKKNTHPQPIVTATS